MSMEWKWKSCYMLCGTHIACSIFHLKPVPGDRAGDTQIHAIGLQFFFSRWLLPFDFHCSFSISCSKYKYAPFYPFFVTILHSCLPCDYLFIYLFIRLFFCLYFTLIQSPPPSSPVSHLLITTLLPPPPSPQRRGACLLLLYLCTLRHLVPAGLVTSSHNEANYADQVGERGFI